MQAARYKWFTVRAWLVHLYTSLGIVAGFMALGAVLQQDVQRVFLWLGVALFIDSSDGTLARAWDVKRWASAFDGRKLDDITDYLNFTFIPVFFAFRIGMVNGVGVVALAAVLLSSAYGFCQSAAKTNDGYFTGFPSFWNLLIFYMYLFNLSPAVNALVLSLFSAMVFVPVKYLSFSTPQMQRITKAIAALYGLVLAWIVIRLDQPQPGLILASLIFPLGYMVYPLVERRRMRRLEKLAD
jgi:phosphatidylcholine synthase